MHRSYRDIISRIPEPPLWWQMNGVPRYEKFNPPESGGVYGSELALVEIACQATDIRFLVVFEGGKDREIATAIRNFSLEYGDPPNVAGIVPHMSSETIRVHEYWFSSHREFVEDGVITNWQLFSEWRRDHSLELVFPGSDPDKEGVFWSPAKFDEAASMPLSDHIRAFIKRPGL